MSTAMKRFIIIAERMPGDTPIETYMLTSLRLQAGSNLNDPIYKGGRKEYD